MSVFKFVCVRGNFEGKTGRGLGLTDCQLIQNHTTKTTPSFSDEFDNISWYFLGCFKSAHRAKWLKVKT